MKKLSFKKAIKFLAKHNADKPIYYAIRADWFERNNEDFMFTVKSRNSILNKSTKNHFINKPFIVDLSDFKEKWIIKKYK